MQHREHEAVEAVGRHLRDPVDPVGHALDPPARGELRERRLADALVEGLRRGNEAREERCSWRQWIPSYRTAAAAHREAPPDSGRRAPPPTRGRDRCTCTHRYNLPSAKPSNHSSPSIRSAKRCASVMPGSGKADLQPARFAFAFSTAALTSSFENAVGPSLLS